jgi:hypothetical protein
MPCDYAFIRAENEKKYGTEVSHYGRDFADRYTERTHFIFELLQNAEDALRWREEADPKHSFPRNVKFLLFPDHLEVTHYGLPFNEEHVRGICSIKRGTKQEKLTDLGKFGIGFKSVYAHTKSPEVHSGDEHFVIQSYVHPQAVATRKPREGETLFYIPFDHDEILPEQAYAEISERLSKLGSRTLLFLNQIDSIDWEIVGKGNGSYIREGKNQRGYKEVTLGGQANTGNTSMPFNLQEWLVFSRPVITPQNEIAGQVEVAFKLASENEGSTRSIVKAEDANLVVFFPTEKETHCGFLIQGPYKTTPSRDNVPHDNKWNSYLVKETAVLLAETLIKLVNMKMVSIGLLQALPLLRNIEIPDAWMFQPLYDVMIKTLMEYPLIPAAGGRFVSGRCARFARGKGLVELFGRPQLTQLLTTDEGHKLDWVSPEISESRSGTSSIFAFLRHDLEIKQIEPEDLPWLLTEQFFQAQSLSWMAKFYAFLLDHERLWRIGKPRGALLDEPFIRLQDNRHVAPFQMDGTPNAYLPADADSNFDTVHRLLAKHKKCAEFFRKLGLSEPDIVSEVLDKIVPQYESDEIDISDKKHDKNIRKILRALASDSPNRQVLIDRLKPLTFLSAIKRGSEEVFLKHPGYIYFRNKRLETYFDQCDDVWFLSESETLIGRSNIENLLKELGVEDKPRRILVQTEDDHVRKNEIRNGENYTYDIHYFEYDIHGLNNFLKTLRKSEFPEAVRRVRLLWEFLVLHLEVYLPGSQKDFFRGEYQWKYYNIYTRYFDAYFLRVLCSTTWLPGKDGKLHRPSELLPQEMHSGFVRHPVLCEVLQMKAEALVNLAKEAGVRVEDLLWLRQHRAEFEKFKRSLKEKPPADITPVHEPSGMAPNPTTARPPDNLSQSGASTGQVSDAINELLGSESGGSTAMPPELTQPDPAGIIAGGGAGRSSGSGGASTGGGAGQGSSREPPSNAASAAAGKRTPGSEGGRPFVSYIGAHPDDEGPDPDGLEHTARMALEEKAIRKILVNEPDLKRTSTNNPGFDLFLAGSDGNPVKWIEVKAMTTDMKSRPAGLSHTQFTCAQEHKEAYWLYVVEHAADPETARIVRIQDPAGKARTFTFDHGWLSVAEVSQKSDDE